MPVRGKILGIEDGWVGKCLPNEHERLSSNPQNPCENSGVVGKACNSTAAGEGRGGSLVLAGQLVLLTG